MIYSLLRDQEMIGFQFGLKTSDEQPLSRSLLIEQLDESLEQAAQKIAAEPWASPMVDIAARHFATAGPGQSLEAVQVRKRRPGKPDPATWGWQPSNGITPLGIEP